MKNIALLFGLTFLFLPPASSGGTQENGIQGKITLEQAVMSALSRQSTYTNAILAEEEADILTELAEKNRRFSLDFDSSYRYISETMEVETPSVQIPGLVSVPSNTISAGVFHNFDFKLSARRPLYSGGLLKNSIRLAEVQKAIRAQQSRLRRLEIAASIKSSYFQHLTLLRRRQSLEALKKNMALHEERLERFLGEGLIKKTALLETRTRLEDVDVGLLEILGKIRESEIQFRSVCGYSPGDIEAHYREPDISQAEAHSYFLKNHPVLSSLDFRLKSLDIQMNMTKGRYRPQVNSFAELHYGRPGIDFFKKDWSVYFTGGVVLHVPVFNWKQLQNEKDLNGIQAKKVRNEKAEFTRELQSGLDSLFAELDVIGRINGSLGRIINLAEEDAALKSELVKERQIPNIDYLTALLLLEQKKMQKQELFLTGEMVKVRINTLIGRLED
jgi:outer membrane protein TolC